MSKDMNITTADQMVGEYLIYRGFTQSFRSLESERSKDKTRQFEATRIVEAIFSYMHNYEIEQFILLWDFLSKRFFFHLDGEHLGYSISLKSELLKYYLVNAIKQNRKEKLTEFFSMFSHEILAEAGDHIAGNLRGWFVLPYMDEPEKDTEFAVYFAPRWSESLRTTIANFLSIVLSSAPPPKLLLLEKWFHSEAQVEMRSQLALSSRKVDALLAKLERAEERITQLRTVVKDLVLHVQKTTAASSVANGGNAATGGRSASIHGGSLFETDEEVDFKRDKAKVLGQAVCRSATEVVHKAAHIATMSREVRLREMLGDAVSVFLPPPPPSASSSSGSSHGQLSGHGTSKGSAADDSAHKTTILELETNLILMINQWIKNMAV